MTIQHKNSVLQLLCNNLISITLQMKVL